MARTYRPRRRKPLLSERHEVEKEFRGKVGRWLFHRRTALSLIVAMVLSASYELVRDEITRGSVTMAVEAIAATAPERAASSGCSITNDQLTLASNARR